MHHHANASTSSANHSRCIRRCEMPSCSAGTTDATSHRRQQCSSSVMMMRILRSITDTPKSSLAALRRDISTSIRQR